ncbi:MAG: hypothetical protein L6R30_16040 [Thermoanaerobaculia bacterium]|nr:hypothetical protein [Thermoanaerobaculia bacterium]
MPESLSAVVDWSIGLVPVQDWITAARRSRDLRAGSAYLSWIMATLLSRLEKETSADIAVPRPPQGIETFQEMADKRFRGFLADADYSIPNRASGSITGMPFDKARAFFGTLQSTVDSCWTSLRTEARDVPGVPRKLRELLTSGDSRGPIHVVWVARERLAGEKEGLALVDRLYSAVKRTRPVQPHLGHSVGKCGQCGRNEAIGPRDWKEWREFHQGLSRDRLVVNQLRFDPGERFCAVCGVKRLAGYLPNVSFPSTSDVAVSRWKAALQLDPDLYRRLDDFDKKAREIGGISEDASDRSPLLYKRTLDRRILDAQNAMNVPEEAGGEKRSAPTPSPGLPERLEGLRGTLVGLYTAAGNKGLPSNYVAAVTFDGDNMGRQVRQDPAAAASSMRRFADGLSESIKSHGATAFYLGGDEGLLLSPIETVMNLADGIHESWTQATTGTTLSMGICIFDREQPLGQAIQTAREALHAAKRLKEKDALSVTVRTASGSEWRTTAKWGATWTRIRTAIELIQAGTLAAGWAHDVEALMKPLPRQAWVDSRDAIRVEVERITRRRTSKDPRPHAGRPAPATADAWSRLDGASWWLDDPGPDLMESLSNQLHLVSFLARESGPDTTASPAEPPEPKDEKEP